MNQLERFLRIWEGAFFSEGNCFLDLLQCLTLNVDQRAFAHAAFEQRRAEQGHGITFILELVHLFGGPITALDEQADAMFVKAIGLGFDQGRTFAATGPRDGFFSRLETASKSWPSTMTPGTP